MNEAWVDLSDAITAVREEIRTAMSAGQDSPVRFGGGKVELEFSLAVRREGQGKVRVNVLSAGVEAGGGVSSERLNRVQVTFDLVGRDGKPVDVSDPVIDRPR
ncbi:trypco2 family protein [Streptomyces sp. NPDC057271]|uniref:trypco2 family protein n=1 Tax=unclassified Streptomyces TaxID=2593676 RepID=UPI0036339F0A